MTARQWELAVGFFFVGLGLVLVLLWIPLDVESGIIEKHRRRVRIGDAMLPTCIAVGFILCGLAAAFAAYRRGGETGSVENSAGLGRDSLAYLLSLIGIMAIGLVLMRWVGPVAVLVGQELGMDIPGYRSLRDTIPWKYLGYLAGGFVIVFGLIAYMDHRVSWRAFVVALLATLILGAIYDIPFDDLVLPPNGDV